MGYDDRYDPDTDFDRWYTKGTGEAILRWISSGDRVLELGCATGAMTEQFTRKGAHVVAIDRSKPYLARAAERGLEHAVFVEADLATLDLAERFAHVVAANVAHEVPNLEGFLGRCRQHLQPGGHVHVSLQNPQSIHRLVGRAMGLISDLHEVSDRGREFETLRLLEADELAAAGQRAGLRCIHREGVMVKPLANARMADLPDDILEAFLVVASELPDHCAMNYLVFDDG